MSERVQHETSRRRALRVSAGVVLVANLLDVTTSLIPYVIDRWVVIPPRSTAEWVLQLGLIAVGALWLTPRIPGAVRALWRLPIPRPALLVCGAFLLVELGHVAMRFERFPFSPVAMYSDAHDRIPADWEVMGFLVQHPEGTRIFSFQREGDPLFAEYFTDLDYKGAAALRMYREEDTVYDIVRKPIEARGLPPPLPVRLRYRTSTGEVIWMRRLDERDQELKEW